MEAVLYVPDGAEVNLNSEPYYQNSEYINGEKGNVEIKETTFDG